MRLTCLSKWLGNPKFIWTSWFHRLIDFLTLSAQIARNFNLFKFFSYLGINDERVRVHVKFICSNNSKPPAEQLSFNEATQIKECEVHWEMSNKEREVQRDCPRHLRKYNEKWQMLLEDIFVPPLFFFLFFFSTICC